MENQESITLQLHYFFRDEDLHTMNAKVHNDCEKQFIQAIQLLNKYLDSPIEVDVFAKKEGGIEDYYKLIIKDPLVLIILTALLTGASTQFFTSNYAPAISVTEETKNKLDNITKIKELIKTNSLTSEEFDYIVANDKDLKKLKSNFYRSAKKEKAITSIEIKAIKQDQTFVFEKKSILYEEFDNCILPDEQEKNNIEVDAKIEIVAPVLIRGRKDNWKGIYNGDSIEFRVSDKVFLENVYHHIIKFSNGTSINCKMKITTTTSSIDDKERISRDVFSVENWSDDENIITITKRKKKIIPNNQDNQSPTLFSDNDF